jgi:hypothetical protein
MIEGIYIFGLLFFLLSFARKSAYKEESLIIKKTFRKYLIQIIVYAINRPPIAKIDKN